MTWLVCGGRDFQNYLFLSKVLDGLVESMGKPDLIVHGDCRGADRSAGIWGITKNIAVTSVPADWAGGGKKAGYIRNGEMLKRFHPDLVIAFPGGAGTRNMIRQSREWHKRYGKPMIREFTIHDVKEFENNERS